MLLVRRGGDRGERGHGAAPLHHEGVALVAAAAAPGHAGRVRAGRGGGGSAGQPRLSGGGEFFCKRGKKWSRFKFYFEKSQRRDGAAQRQRDSNCKEHPENEAAVFAVHGDLESSLDNPPRSIKCTQHISGISIHNLHAVGSFCP